MIQQDDIKRHIYTFATISFLVLAGLIYYTISSINTLNSTINFNFDKIQNTLNYNITIIKDNLNNQINDINKSVIIFQSRVGNSMVVLEDRLRSELYNESTILKSNLSSQISLVEESLGKSTKEQQETLSKLSSAIEEVSSSYTSNLEKLRTELIGLNVATINITNLDFSETIKKTLPSIVSVITNHGQASGVFVSAKEVITNYHVVSVASNITILTNSGKSYLASIKFYNETSDLALLEVQASESFQSLKLTSLSDVELGSHVIAIGNPYGLGFSVTEGIISGLNRIGPNGLTIYIQTDVPVNPGNSGGPLINIKGEIVGITTFKISNSEGLGFAIGADYVKDFLQS